MSKEIEGNPEESQTLNWEQTLEQYSFMSGITEEAKQGWLALPREFQIAHIDRLKAQAQKNIPSKAEDWKPIKSPVIGHLPS